jgi:hypothetical protein
MRAGTVIPVARWLFIFPPDAILETHFTISQKEKNGSTFSFRKSSPLLARASANSG